MFSYTTIAGDTFESISRNTSGTESAAGAIAAANPGSVEPFIAGIVLYIPPVAGAPRDRPQSAPSDDKNSLTIQINNKRFTHWSAIEITSRVDGISTFSLQAPLNTSDQEFKDNFKPFSYNNIQINIGGEPLFTGTIVDVDPLLNSEERLVGVSGYSLPGVLSDCTPPAPKGNYQLEFNNYNVVDTANALCQPFGIFATTADGDPGPTIRKVKTQPEEKIFAFLTKLAQQSNFVISNNPSGELLFQKAEGEGNQIVANYVQGEPGLLSVTPSFDPQNYYSHVTGLGQTYISALPAKAVTVPNKRLKTTLRPFTYRVPDVHSADIAIAVNAKIGRMYANAASYSISVPTWRDSSGNLWKPNTFINVTAPDAMIYKKYKFLIRSVTLRRTPETEIAFLDLIIPGTFSGISPEVLPWDD